MKIFKVELKEELKDFDFHHAHVVIASNENEARNMIDKKYDMEFCKEKIVLGLEVWLSNKYSICEEIALDKASIVLSHYCNS